MTRILLAFMIVTMPLSVGANDFNFHNHYPFTGECIAPTDNQSIINGMLEAEDACDNPFGGCPVYPKPKDDKAEELPCCIIPDNFDELYLKDCRICEESKSQEWLEKCEKWLDNIDSISLTLGAYRSESLPINAYKAQIATAYCTRALLEEIRK